MKITLLILLFSTDTNELEQVWTDPAIHYESIQACSDARIELLMNPLNPGLKAVGLCLDPVKQEIY